MRVSFVLFVVLLSASCKKNNNENQRVPKGVAMYIQDQNNATRLWYMNYDGSSFTRVNEVDLGTEFLSNPSWSFDGSNIFYIRNSSENGKNGVYMLKPNGNYYKPVYIDNETQSRSYYQLVTSHDETYVIFSLTIPRDGRNVTELYSMCPCGQNVSRLTTFEIEKGGSPASTAAYAGSFSPDNKYLYFSQTYDMQDGPKTVGIYSIDMVSKEKKLLSTVQVDNPMFTTPVISPDGEKILLSLNSRIYLMDSDGSNLTALGIIDGHKPQWDNNNTDILFSSYGVSDIQPGIYKTDITAKTPVVISKQSSASKYGGFSVNNK